MDDAYINEVPVMADVESKNLTKSIQDVNGIKYWRRNYIVSQINKISNRRHKMLLQFLWMTGVRISEALYICKSDIDFKNYFVKIRWQKSKKGRHRNIPLHPNLKDMLDYYTASFNQDDLIFPFSRQRAFQIIKRYMGGNPHMFRHSFAVNWIVQGGSIVVLSRMMGHSDIKVTYQQYGQIAPVDQGQELIKIKFDKED